MKHGLCINTHLATGHTILNQYWNRMDAASWQWINANFMPIYNAMLLLRRHYILRISFIYMCVIFWPFCTQKCQYSICIVGILCSSKILLFYYNFNHLFWYLCTVHMVLSCPQRCLICLKCFVTDNFWLDAMEVAQSIQWNGTVGASV